ncbi:MAG: NUDIX domain-containing protein [Vicinamibacterales bacterium]
MTLVLQAGAIAVRHQGGSPQVLVVRAKRNPEDWIFPKGHIEPGETAPDTAVRELLEEAGVIGRVSDLVGVSRFQLGERLVQVSYYLVWYVADGEAVEHRERAWLPLRDARAQVSYADMRALIDRLESLIGTSVDPG